MNRVQFQQWLEQFPEDTIIEVGVQERSSGWESYGAVKFEEFIGDYDQHDFFDFTGNQYIGNDHPYYGKVYLQLGSCA